MPQVLNAIQNSNANAGGNYLTLGDQNINVRAIGLLKNTDDIGSIVVAERNGAPVLVRDVGEVKEGFQPRLGKVGRNAEPDVVLGIVLLQKDEKSLPALEGLKKKIHDLNRGSLLPPGMHISTVYDRTNLINTTTKTVRHVVFTGLFLVTLVLISMLGDLRISFIAAVTIPFAVLFAFSMMVLTGQSANLISIGAIDFGILVDASIVVLESIYRKLSRRDRARKQRRPHHRRRQQRCQARAFCHLHHSRGVHSPLHHAGSPGQDLRAHVGYLWICAYRRTHLLSRLRSRARPN